MQKPTQKTDPVDIIIVVCGILFGCLILYGFISSLTAIYSWKPPTPQYAETASSSANVTLLTDTSNVSTQQLSLTEADNTTQHQISFPTDITLELPEAKYPKANLLLFGNPQGTLTLVGTTAGKKAGDWAVVLRATQKGAADVIVQTKNQNLSDFHVSFIVE